MPFAKRQPGQASQRAAVLYGQSNLFERIRRGTSTSIPPTASMSSSNRSKSTNATWLTSSPVSSFTVRSASAGPPIWFAALIFAVPTSGISTWRSRGIERNARRPFPGSVRSSMIESERLAPSRPARLPPSLPSTRIVVGVESSIPSVFVSWRRTPAGTRSFAASTPFETER